MIIKKYLQFINEDENTSLGQWISSLIEDEYVRNIVARYTQEIDPSIDLENAINLLDKRTQLEIKEQIEEYLQKGIEEKQPDILTSTDTEQLWESEITVAGKGMFASFLKSLTALGQKDCLPNWEKTPNDFLFYYHFSSLQSEIVKSVFMRFKSLSRYLDLIDYQQNEVSLYFGIKCDGNFEYGMCYDNLLPIGQFKLNQSVIKWILSLESKSAFSLKKELVNLTYSDILILGQIKRDIDTFNPGYFEKKLFPQIKDRVFSFGFYGVGKWDNGQLDQGEFMNIKNNFTTWLISKKWGGKVLISVPQPKSFWFNLHIKLK
jgi:hypothetical protein